MHTWHNHVLVAFVVAAWAALAPACSSSESSGATATHTAASNTTTSSAGEGGFSLATGGGGSGGGDGGGGGLKPFCEGSGPPIGIPLLGDCTGDVAKSIFLFGVCSCSDITAYNTFNTDSYDSSKGPQLKKNGSVGANGKYTGTSPVDLHGTLWTAGSATWQNKHDLRREVRCGGDLQVGHSVHLYDDLYVDGNISAPSNFLMVDGKLHIPAASSYPGVNPAGGVVNEPVTVQPPCDCSTPLDITALVASFANNNDNAEQLLAPEALSEITESAELTLPCGRYYLSEITPLGAEVTITLEGRTAIFVAGDLNPTNTFTITLGPEAELDLFVAGDLTIANTFAIGDKDRAAKTRVYVGGKGKFTSPTQFAGNLYLPNHTLQVQNQLEVWGSLFVGGLNIVSPLSVHYDEAILLIDGCPDLNTECEDCHDCINPKPACNSGLCAACSSDDDCCPPFKCMPNGSCTLEGPN